MPYHPKDETPNRMDKTNQEHFEIFKAEANYWIDRLHLREWRFLFVHKDHEQAPDCFAWKITDLKGRVATIGLSEDWGEAGWEEINQFNLSKSAFHEIIEVMLSDIDGVARLDICPTDQEDLETYIHSVIRRLEYTLFEPDYNKRNE